MRGRRMRPAIVAMAVWIGLLGLTPVSAQAQEGPLAGLLPELILRDIILLPGMLGPVHIAHFSPIEVHDVNNPAVGIVQAFNNQLATQFATFPLGSSTGGLTYVFDESLGTLRRGSASFGPLFAERALTIGRGKLSAGFNYQRTSDRYVRRTRSRRWFGQVLPAASRLLRFYRSGKPSRFQRHGWGRHAFEPAVRGRHHRSLTLAERDHAYDGAVRELRSHRPLGCGARGPRRQGQSRRRRRGAHHPPGDVHCSQHAYV